MTISWVKTTAVFSLGVQFLTGLSNIWGFTLTIRPEAQIFYTLLIFEFIIQVIEFVAYIVLTFFLFQDRQQHHKTIMTIRYMDWMVTTPTMLITLMAYLSGEHTLSVFFQKHVTHVSNVLVLNWMMLYLGYQNEMLSFMFPRPVGYHKKTRTTKEHRSSYTHPRLTERFQWVFLGWIPFFFMFGLIWSVFYHEINKDHEKRFIFTWFLVFWSLYGIAAFFSFTTRNSMYNILDIFSKNITGLFLVWKLYSFREKGI